jgi:hypothetical protein
MKTANMCLLGMLHRAYDGDVQAMFPLEFMYTTSVDPLIDLDVTL